MDRREFLNISAATTLVAAAPAIITHAAAAEPVPPPAVAPWRTFDVTAEVEIWPQDVPARLWLPLPQYLDTEYQRALDVRWSGNPVKTGIYRDPRLRRAVVLCPMG